MDLKDQRKERSKETGNRKIPIPISDIDIDTEYRRTGSADFHQEGGNAGYRRACIASLTADDFFNDKYDPVDIACVVVNGKRNDRLLWRKYLREGAVTDAELLECAYRQWREDAVDGRGDNPAACLQAKLNAIIDEKREARV